MFAGVGRVAAPTVYVRTAVTGGVGWRTGQTRKEKSTEWRVDQEADAELENPLLSPKEENETAELGGSVTKSLLIRLRFGTRISTPFSPSELSLLVVV